MKEIEQNLKLLVKQPYTIKKDPMAEDPLNEEEGRLLANLKNLFESNLYMWDFSKAEDFKFILPNTVFSQEKKINFTAFDESEVKYDDSYLSRSLTSDQLSEIFKGGKFSVKSKDGNVPYIWQLSQWLHKGTDNIRESFYDDFSWAFYFLYCLRYRFSTDRNFIFFSIPQSFKFILVTLKSLWGLYFGRAKYSNQYLSYLNYPQTIDSEIFVDYQKNILRENPEIITSIFYPKFQALINKIQLRFNIKWGDESIEVEHRLRESELSAKEIKEKLSSIRFDRLIEEVQNENKIDPRRKQYYIDMLKSEDIYSKILFNEAKKINDVTTSFRAEIKKTSPILSRVDAWCNSELEIKKKNRVQEILNETEEIIEDKLSSYRVQKMLIQSYRNFLKCAPANRKLYIERKEPTYSRSYYCIRKLRLPEYTIITNEYLKQKYYTLGTTKSIEVISDCSYWRVKLLYTRIHVTYFNTIVFCYNNCFNSSFGLKALYADRILTNYMINYNTGAIESEEFVFTYYSALVNLKNSIVKSRSDFERARDSGFLGGSVGKFLNILENYIGRLIFGGLAYGILYPVMIVFNTVICFFLSIIGFFLSIVLYFLGVICCILIYDYDYPEYGACRILPLFTILFYRLFILSILNFVFGLCSIIGQILLSIFMCFFGVLRRASRTLYDLMTYAIIKCNGKIPKDDTSFAWRISGPGTNRKLFYKLQIEEALLLVRAQLEKDKLECFRAEIYESLREPQMIHEGFNNRILKNLSGSINPDFKLAESINKYIEVVNKQINERYSVYPPTIYDVRFTKDDLEILLEASFDLIKEYVGRDKSDFIWKKNKLLENNWRLLTERILIQTFGSEDILVNVDQSDLKNDSSNKIDNEVKSLYEKVGLNKNLDTAVRKKAMFANFGSSAESFINEGESYHDYKNPQALARKRININEFSEVTVAPNIDLYIYQEHFKVDYNNDLFSEERKLKDIEEDDTIID